MTGEYHVRFLVNTCRRASRLRALTIRSSALTMYVATHTMHTARRYTSTATRYTVNMFSTITHACMAVTSSGDEDMAACVCEQCTLACALTDKKERTVDEQAVDDILLIQPVLLAKYVGDQSKPLAEPACGHVRAPARTCSPRVEHARTTDHIVDIT